MTEDCRLQAKNPLEPFLLLAKNARGAAAAELIKQATAAPGVYVFGELLESPAFQELATSEWSKEWNLLNLFAYGTFKEFLGKKDALPELSNLQETKLRHLTIVSLASSSKCLSYSLLLEELKLDSLRELEDLIIEGIYSDVMKGKLDQKQQQLHLESTIGRDITPQTICKIAEDLTLWCTQCENTLNILQQQIQIANGTKEANQKEKRKVELAVENLKAAIVNQSSEMSSTMMDTSQSLQSTSGAAGTAAAKKPSKTSKSSKPFSLGKSK